MKKNFLLIIGLLFVLAGLVGLTWYYPEAMISLYVLFIGGIFFQKGQQL